MKHEGKVAIITGGNSGIGLATAIELAKNGAHLVLVDYNEATAEEAIKTIKEVNANVEVDFVKTDVSKEEDIKNVFDFVMKKHGRVDYLFNNAGIDGQRNLIHEYDVDTFNRVMAINVNGVFYGLKYALEIMYKQGSGSIVNTSSVLGIRASQNMSAYVASKHAVVGLTRCAGIEAGRHGVRVNCVSPGAVLTPMVEVAFKKMNPENPLEAQKEFAKNNPLKRFAMPEEIAKAVCFLFSDDSSYLNGQVMALEGGEIYKFGVDR